MKKFLLILTLLFTAKASNAQFATGWTKAMNFGGAGVDVEEMRYVDGDLYFIARLMGKYQFAGNNYDAGALMSYPDQEVIFGKITNSGTQVLIQKFKSVDLSAIGSPRIGADGSLYIFRLGLGTEKSFGSLTAPAYGLQLMKISANGQFSWIKKQHTFSDTEFGTSGVPGPNFYGMQVKDNGEIYAIFKSNTLRGSVYATRVIKFDATGDEVWHYELTATSAGTSTAGILISNMPRQFVDDNGNLAFVAATTGTINFNGETLPYEEPYTYGGYGNLKNWIISLNSSGNKKWSTSCYVQPTFYGVNPTSGDIYLNYQYSRQSPAVPATIAPFASLPNLAPPPPFDYIPATYAWSGIITLNTSGAIVKAKNNYVNAIAYPTQLERAANGRMLLYSATANGNVFKAGDNFISFDGSGYVAMEVDTDFNPISVFRLPAGSTLAVADNKFAVGGSFKTSTTIGSSTLTPNFVDTDFNTRFPSWASIKADVLIAEGGLDQMPQTPETTTWKGLSTNWTDAANWTNGVPTNSMRAVFSGTPANMPANIPSSSKAGQIYIPVGADITLPPGYGLLTIADRIFNEGKLTVENASFLFNFFGVSEVKGSGEFYFKGAASVFNFTGKIANTVSFDNNLSMSGATVNALKFIGPAAKFIGDVTISSSNVDAISGLTATSVVNGTLTRAVNPTGTYSFPVAAGSGSSEKSSLVTFTPNGLTGTNAIAVKYTTSTTGITPSLTANGSVISSVLNGGLITVTPNVQPTAGNYALSMSLKSSTNTVADVSRYVLIKRDNSLSPWVFQGQHTTAATSTGTGVNNVVGIHLEGISSFSDFAIGIGNSPVTLPVKLTKFAAKAMFNSVLLTWETATEANSDKFLVERSTDGKLFFPLDEVKANGYSNSAITYNLHDQSPQSGMNYYRLKQIDLDGSFEYSEILPVGFGLGSGVIKLYPNPTSNKATIRFETGRYHSLTLSDASGRIVNTKVIGKDQNQLDIDLSRLSSGLYLVTLSNKEEKTVHKLIRE